MKVLVTGAAGNVGMATCKELMQAGIDFRATDARTRRNLEYRVQVANLTNREVCYGLVEDCDAIVHIANHPNEHSGSAQAVYAENCAMNVNLFQAGLETGVKKIVFASSIQAIIGSRKFHEVGQKPSCLAYLPLDGDMPAVPGNPYAASKEAGELLLKFMAQHRALESGVAVRLCGLVMPDWYDWMRRHPTLDKTWRDEYADEAFSWLTFADAGRLFVAILKRELPGYRCYLPAHPTLRVDDPVAEVVRRCYADVPLKRPLEELRGLVDISRITAETGWVPQDDFRAEIARREEAKKASAAA